MLGVRELMVIYRGRSRNYIYRLIRNLKFKHNLSYEGAEIPLDIIIKETGISRRTIYDLLQIKKADAATSTGKN